MYRPMRTSVLLNAYVRVDQCVRTCGSMRTYVLPDAYVRVTQCEYSRCQCEYTR